MEEEVYDKALVLVGGCKQRGNYEGVLGEMIVVYFLIINKERDTSQHVFYRDRIHRRFKALCTTKDKPTDPKGRTRTHNFVFQKKDKTSPEQKQKPLSRPADRLPIKR